MKKNAYTQYAKEANPRKSLFGTMVAHLFPICQYPFQTQSVAGDRRVMPA